MVPTPPLACDCESYLQQVNKGNVFSGQGDTIVSILTDYNGFLSYENRELLNTEDAEDAEADGQLSDEEALDDGEVAC